MWMGPLGSDSAATSVSVVRARLEKIQRVYSAPDCSVVLLSLTQSTAAKAVRGWGAPRSTKSRPRAGQRRRHTRRRRGSGCRRGGLVRDGEELEDGLVEGFVVVPEGLRGGEVVLQEGAETGLADEVFAAAVGGGVGERGQPGDVFAVVLLLVGELRNVIWACAIVTMRRRVAASWRWRRMMLATENNGNSKKQKARSRSFDFAALRSG